jgi:hypothetical protein
MFINIEDNWTMVDIMTKSNIFKSRSDARRNGWNKNIKLGFSDFYSGKLRTRITILNLK